MASSSSSTSAVGGMMIPYGATALVAAVIMRVYVATLAPSIAGGDAGEIVAEGCSLGTAHPPGYPLLTMIIYAIKLYVPASLGSVAYRVNLFSALLTTFAAVCMAYMVTIIRGSQRVRNNVAYTTSSVILVMGMFSFSPLIWQYAITAEVFPLNTAFAALIVCLVVTFAHKVQSQADAQSLIWIVRAGALVCGLALCNQHTIILFEAPLVLWMLILSRNYLLKYKFELVILSALFFVGLAPYLYMPIMATIKPTAGSWGHVTTASGFLHHFLRKDYGTFQLFSGNRGKQTESMMERNVAYFHDLMNDQGTAVTVLLVVVGIVLYRCEATTTNSSNSKHTSDKAASIAANIQANSPAVGKAKQGKASKVESTPTATSVSQPTNASMLFSPNESKYTFYVLLLTLVFYFAVFHSLSNLPLDNKLLYGVHQRFWMQPNIITFLVAAVGYQEFWHGVETVLSKQQPTKSPLFVQIANVLSVCIAVALVVLQYRRNLYMSDLSEAPHFRNYATAVLSPLPPNATLLINYDQQWTSVRYLQRCEGFRSDVTTINLSMMTYSWFQYKHDLYPNLVFPGTHHSNQPVNTPPPAKKKSGKSYGNHTFTLYQFLEANPNVPIFLGGKVNVPDAQFDAHYESVPIGLVSRLSKVTETPTGPAYKESVEKHLKFVADLLIPNMPLEKKFPEVCFTRKGRTWLYVCW
jgi:hypothetical protein